MKSPFAFGLLLLMTTSGCGGTDDDCTPEPTTETVDVADANADCKAACLAKYGDADYDSCTIATDAKGAHAACVYDPPGCIP